MGDVVTCKAVLSKTPDPNRPDYLLLVTSKTENDFRSLPCYPKGGVKTEFPQWQYEEQGGRLLLTPSLLCTDTNFHTDYNWNIAYELRPEDSDDMGLFFKINPDRSP